MPPPARRDAAPRPPATWSSPRSPRSPQQLPTTAPSIALGNLESQLEERVRGAAEDPAPAALASLASLYLAHGQILGHIADWERAGVLAERAARGSAADPTVLAVRASTRAAFHRFDEALADLDRAAALGAERSRLDAQRAAILQAQGRFAEARAIRERLARERATLESLGALAGLDGEEGRVGEAERHFAEALDRFADVTPFPVAWLWLQQGLLWQREGRPARARELFAAAVERVPGFAAAEAHLAEVDAELGEKDQALVRLRSVVERSDDPEYSGKLASLLLSAGDAVGGAAWVARARLRFEELLAAHPAAFADHAARFFLDAGADPARALALAESNAAARRTPDAARLLLEAATRAGAPARACEAADVALALAPGSIAVHHAAWRAFRDCRRPERADAVLARAEELAGSR